MRIKISSQGFEPIKEEVLQLEAQVQNWINRNELDRDVLLEKSTFKKWWEDLPIEHKLTSCIKDLSVS